MGVMPWQFARLTLRDMGALADGLAMRLGVSAERRPSPQEKAQALDRLEAMMEAKRGASR